MKASKHFLLLHGSLESHYRCCLSITEIQPKSICLWTGGQKQMPMITNTGIYTQKAATPTADLDFKQSQAQTTMRYII